MKKIYIKSCIVLLVIGISVTVSAQTTKLSPGFCNATGIAFDQDIYADAIGSAIAYEFLVENYQMNFSEYSWLSSLCFKNWNFKLKIMVTI
ncbi:MAG: hypothetical protein HY738_21065 [Bacteroidia bacterium]|nr:hypothetical protein [Bacteroidia bacterium]